MKSHQQQTAVLSNKDAAADDASQIIRPMDVLCGRGKVDHGACVNMLFGYLLLFPTGASVCGRWLLWLRSSSLHIDLDRTMCADFCGIYACILF